MATANSTHTPVQNRLIVVSYNLHGYNQGIVGLKELINLLTPDAIFVQEHWLTPDNLNKLDAISNDYYFCGSSAMGSSVSAGPLYGRPFGGTAILINKKLATCTINIMSCDRFTVIKIANWLLFNVYMPCSGTSQRLLLYNDVLQEMQGLIHANPNCQYLFGGDFNTDLNAVSSISAIVNGFICSNSLSRCDTQFPISNPYTYVNESLDVMSTIDYFITSDLESTIAFNIVDLDINLSDHLPIMVVCSCQICDYSKLSSSGDISYFRWDHAPVDLYYEHTRVSLQPVLDELDLIIDNISTLSRSGVIDAVDRLYNDVVCALQSSSSLFIPKRKKNFYKFWWSQELDSLKESAILSCRIWKDACKPRQGPIFNKYKQDKLLYKQKIKEEQARETCSFTNDLHDALLRKQGAEFWKSWNSKFEAKTNYATLIDGTSDHEQIANNFANHFEAVCSPLTEIRNEELKSIFTERRSTYIGSPVNDSELFTVELITDLVTNMRNGKAAGLDELSCEHLKFSHPIVIVILCRLFKVFISHCHIPRCFGLSYTVPISKCDVHRRALTVNDFRGISISPVISKLFELAVIDRFSRYFETSDCQFGFKKNLSCRHVIFSVRNVIEHYISNGTTVNMCSLDLSKAFDRMNHYALLIKLMERKLPNGLVTILEQWFCWSQTCVKWGSCSSYFFPLKAGVRQGGVLSPLLFSVYIDGVVDKIRACNVGCHIFSLNVCIFLYADDIVLLAPTITGLQLLLNTCENELNYLDMQINVKKSLCIRFGPAFDVKCKCLATINDSLLQWSNSCRYLGVHFISGRILKCAFDEAKRQFFRAFNAILSKVGRFASEDVVLNLLRTKCLPCLLYAVEACPLYSRDKHSLEFTITRSFMKLFRTGSSAVVTDCQVFFNFLPIIYQIEIRTAKFMQDFAASQNSICHCFSLTAQKCLHNIYSKYGQSITSLQGLRFAIEKVFF
jgi:exonuclease III